MWVSLLIAGPAFDARAGDHLAQYRVRCWTERDGLPSNAVNAILQSKNGYLWLGTEQGLVRFDGAGFRAVEINGSSDFQARSVTVLIETGDGSIWGGTDGGGLFRLKDHAVTNFTSRDGLSEDVVTSIAEDTGGKIWIGTSGRGVNTFSGGRIGRPDPKDGIPVGLVTRVEAKRDGGVWIASTAGISYLKNGGPAVALPLPDQLKGASVLSLHEDLYGTLWLGTDRGFFNISGGVVKPAFPEQGRSFDKVLTVREDTEGNTWVCTYGGGLKRVSGNVVTSYGMEDGLPDLRIVSFCEDREGNIWLGTRGAGLVQLRKSTIKVWSQKDGLASDKAYTVFQDAGGNLWIGTSGGGLARISGGSVNTFGKEDGLAADSIFAIYGDSDGTTWFGGGDGKLYHYDGSRFTASDFQAGHSPARVSAILRDRSGAMWVGTRGSGAAVLRDGASSFLLGTEAIDRMNVHQFYESADGTVWIAASGGLWRCAGGNCSPFGGSPSLTNKLVFCLYPDEHGCIWAGTYGHGLFRVKGNRVSQITTKQGLFDNVIYSIVRDDGGHFWMSCNRGIFRAPAAELEQLADGRAESVTCQSFGLSEGMLDIECNGGGHPAGFKGNGGIIWFPTARGVIEINPARIVSNPFIPPLFIEGVELNGQNLRPWERCSGPARDGKLVISYSCLSYTEPEKVRFKYFLEGFDRDWVDAGSRITAYYTGLPPGKYRFRVIGCNNDGIWNREGVSLDIYLKPPLYKRGWFILSAWGLGLLLLWGAYRIRVRLHIRRGIELERQVAERTAKLRAQTELIREMEELYRAIVEGQTELVCRFAPNGEITFANGACSKFLEKEGDLAIGGNFFSTIPENRREEIRSALSSASPSNPTILLEHETSGQYGVTKLFQWSHTAFFGDQGKVTGFQSVGRDITELRKMEETLLNAQKMEAIGQLAGGVAHDFNNLLQAMRSSVEILKAKSEGQQTLDRVAEEIENDIRRGAQLVRQVLLFSKREVCNTEPVDLNDLIRNMRALLQRLVRENIGFEMDLMDAPLCVTADVGQIEQVIVNLAINASDAMPEGGRLVVRTGVDGPERGWFEVSDSGHGIPQEVMGRIFEPFFTTKAEENGTGLGLSVVHSIVLQHGGSIAVNSSAQAGTTFRVTLPRTAAPNTEKRPASGAGPVPAATGPERYRILLVEDDKDVREWLAETISMLGHYVVAVSGAEEARATLGLTAFDAVLSDFLLPDGNGAELVRWIKAQNRGMAAVIMSGYAKDNAFSAAPEERWLGFIRKPFSIEQLAEELRRLVECSRGEEGK